MESQQQGIKPKFALIGAAGFVAPRHMKAIKEVGGELVAAVDPHDSVGIIDSYFPDCHFFTEIELFDRYLEKLRRNGRGVDYVSVCSPNYLHDAHCRFGLRLGADVICEKPLVINEKNLDALSELEGRNRIWTVLQLRLHPFVKETIKETKWWLRSYNQVDVDYITPRGRWYPYSWKGDVKKSGGVATNIGIHLFDLVIWLFGGVEENDVIEVKDDFAMGQLWLERASVNWRLSIRRNSSAKRTFEINGHNLDLSTGFAELHTKVYKNILDGKGFGLEETRQAIRVCEEIRNAYHREGK